jgi:hypothetical protein
VESRVPPCLETVPGKCTSPTKNIDQHRDKNAKINRTSNFAKRLVFWKTLRKPAPKREKPVLQTVTGPGW